MGVVEISEPGPSAGATPSRWRQSWPGLTGRSLRPYERHGLLEPARPTGGTRRFSQDDLRRFRRISELVGDGVNLTGICKILDLEQDTRELRTDHRTARRQRQVAGRPRPARAEPLRGAPHQRAPRPALPTRSTPRRAPPEQCHHPAGQAKGPGHFIPAAVDICKARARSSPTYSCRSHTCWSGSDSHRSSAISRSIASGNTWSGFTWHQAANVIALPRSPITTRRRYMICDPHAQH